MDNPLSLYNLSAFVTVDQINSAEQIKTLNLPPIIINDLIRKHMYKAIREVYFCLVPIIRDSRKRKPIVYIDDDLSLSEGGGVNGEQVKHVLKASDLWRGHLP